jgi:hypothetical protein
VAQTKKRRRKKHRGTQGGSIDRRRAGRPRSRQEARARARAQATAKREGPPTWQSAINRGILGALIFLAALLFFFGQPASGAIPLAVFMGVVYVPMGYYLEMFFYNRRQAQRRRQRERERDR